MVDLGKAVHHPPLLQLVQGVEVKMDVAFMPQLGIARHARGETEWLSNLNLE
jgi:hypothetical protein